jgi:hypothetical protein
MMFAFIDFFSMNNLNPYQKFYFLKTKIHEQKQMQKKNKCKRKTNNKKYFYVMKIFFLELIVEKKK